MIKKILVGCFTVFFAASFLAFSTPRSASAAACGAGSDPGLLDFPTWHRGLPCSNGTIDLKNEQPGEIVTKIGLNILDIVLRLAGLVAVGFVIYGGFLYVLANGSPDKAKQGLDTIIKSLVGAVIAGASAIIVSFIVGKII